MQNIEIANNLIALCNRVYLIQVAYLSNDIPGMTDQIGAMEDILRELSAEVYEEGSNNAISALTNMMADITGNLPSCCGGSCAPTSASRSSGIHPGFSAFSSGTAQSPQTSTDGWTPVVSTNIDYVKYDNYMEILSIRFKDGSEYDYMDVPRAVYDGLMSAPSKGRYFHENIKNDFNWDRVR